MNTLRERWSNMFELSNTAHRNMQLDTSLESLRCNIVSVRFAFSQAIGPTPTFPIGRV